ncbi:hypothetical protein [Streptomyces misionensis]|uniref:hypothetical protein n=1 Tax=Streptomyces misionensis TaxID=67331 RepID=UPI0033BF9DA6
MTTAGRAAFLTFTAAFFTAAGKGAVLLRDRAPLDQTGAAYAVALICLLGLCREISRAALEPRRARIPRRIRFRPKSCTCELWWTSAGRCHDSWCRINPRSNR